jgi:wobble nucleotide-excising tRNase
MLQRVIAIKNIGRFRNSALTPNPLFAKHTLIFGANAYGKTTFCAVMRSLQSGDVNPILGRKTLGVAADPEVNLLFVQGNHRLENGVWSAALPEISVFDSVFVSDNVHSGDAVDVPHRRNLFRVIIGRAGVALAEEEQRLAEESRSKQTEITAAERTAQALAPPGMSLAAFLALPADPDIDGKIAIQQQQIQALQQADAIRTRSALTSLTVPSLEDTLEALLAKSVEGVAADAEAQLVAHLDRHHMQEGGEEWVAKGVEYIVDDQCPFCARAGLDALPLIAAYRGLFSDRYRELQREIRAVRAAIDEKLGERPRGALRREAVSNAAGIEFWSQFCAIDVAAFPAVDDATLNIEQAHERLGAIFDRKGRAPLDAIVDDTEFGEAKELLARARAAIDAYNSAVATANDCIAARKAETAAGNLAAAQVELARLQTVKRRHETAAAHACNECQRLGEEKTAIEGRKTVVRGDLEAHTQTVIGPYEGRINYFLNLFNGGFSIARTGHGYPGGVATSTYQLLINNTHVELGNPGTAVGNPSFKNTLSSGDRATLALAFFLAQLERETDLADRVVVFDDPFSSQDAFRRRQTIYEIMRAARSCRQIIVLSHDAQFLKQLWEKCPPDERASIQILLQPSAGSKFAAFDLDDACRGRAAAELDDLIAYRATGAGDPREMIKKLRVVLETHFRFTYQGAFLPNDNLGEILRKIRLGGAAHPAHGDYETLERINDYTTDYHHGEDPRGAPEPLLDQTELLGFVTLTLQVVNALPT